MIERFRRPSVNYLEHQFTIEDPKVLTKPWTSAWRTYTLSANDEDLTENFCTNNEQVEQFQKLLKIESGGTEIASRGPAPGYLLRRRNSTDPAVRAIRTM